MKSNNDILYIFLHVPKCAGTTFRHHIERNFQPGEALGFYRTYQQRATKTKLTKRDVFDTIESLSQDKREKVKIIYGHEIYYGIHEYFNKPARYFTFLRDPTAKTISFYNYRMQEGIKRGFLQANAIPSFATWFHSSPGMHDGMLGDFLRYGFGDRIDNNGDNGNTPSMILDKFYFIGITETFDEDALFLYHALQLRKFYRDQNISKSFFAPGDPDAVKELIASKTAQDRRLYEHGLELNKRFKQSNSHFSTIVHFMRLKRYVAIRSRNFLSDWQ